MLVGAVKRLISMPIKAKGAQQAIAQGMPQRETRTVAMPRERTKGARAMATANRICEYCHAFRRSGFFVGIRVVSVLTRGMAVSNRGRRKGGGRGVKLREGLGGSLAEGEEGDWMIIGRPMEAMNVMMEKTTRESDPTRPISPRASLLSLALASGW